MTRIIAGQARSLRLAVPKAGTRPTSDRVREALFSSLDSLDALSSARVLDLYAGSGALGLEAASRGASLVVFVERDQNATRTLQHNVRAFSETFGTSQAPSMEVVKSTAASFLKVSPVSGDELKKFDLVFLDPPYDLDDAELSENLTLVAHHLSDDAVVVVERSSRSPEPSWPETLRSVKSRRYGETTIWLATQSGVTPFAE